jgi:uncharacterized protein
MIEISFLRKNNKLVYFCVEGHAEYINNDEVIYDDVICGVVSNLAQVTILGVTEILHLNAKYAAEEGHIELDLQEIEEAMLDKTVVLMETMLLGLKNLEISYSEYIKVVEEELQ